VVAFRDAAARQRVDRNAADLISTVAHELRSPLTSVKGFTATLLAKWDRFNDEQKQVMLQTVNLDADRVTRLLADLLDVSRIDAGRLELRRQVVDLPESISRAVGGRVAAGEPESRFVVQLAGELPEMWLDRDKVDQVLSNLLENAVKYGAGTVRIDVMGRPDGAEVCVSDEGTGIPDEMLPRVFAKFWRRPDGGRRSGTGLGLFIVKGLVEAHGGTIEARRGAAGGAEFRFFLPAGAPTFET
jgi:signal transduction histidine kinase